MSTTERPTLATILHDPEDRQFPVARELWDVLATYYSSICVSASDKVSAEFIEFLREKGAIVRQSVRSIGEGRRESISMALEQESDTIQYCDFDRVLHWIRTFPHELPVIAATIANSDFLILGRTERAFASHPPVQQVTEDITNKAFSLAFGKLVDVTAGSNAMNRKTAEIIVKESRSNINDTDTEWPIMIAEKGMRVSYLSLEGLEFETPDYYQDEIEEAGSRETWIEQTYEKPKMWQYRTEMTQKSVERIVEYAERATLIK